MNSQEKGKLEFAYNRLVQAQKDLNEGIVGSAKEGLISAAIHLSELLGRDWEVDLEE